MMHVESGGHSVRRATLPDLNAVSALFDQYRRFYGQSSDIGAAMAFVKARLEGDDSVIFIAVDESCKALGFTQLYPLFSSVRMQRIWILNDLFVAESARNRGVVHSLMLRAAQWDWNWQRPGITWPQNPFMRIWVGNWTKNLITTA